MFQFVDLYKLEVQHLLKIDRINELLKTKGISKAFVASKLGKHRALLNHWESGKSQPAQEDLSILASILGTTVAYLTGESDEEHIISEELPLQAKRLVRVSSDLSDDEIKKVFEYIEFIKSQRSS